jgi:hypothetical protein
MIDLTSDDTPSDKGKQKVDVEMVDAPDQPRTSVAPEDDMVEDDMVVDTLVRHMSGAFEVNCVCFDVLFGLTPFFPWF